MDIKDLLQKLADARDLNVPDRVRENLCAEAHTKLAWCVKRIAELEKSDECFRQVIRKLTEDNHGMTPDWLLDMAS